jgi:hypothetical protein
VTLVSWSLVLLTYVVSLLFASVTVRTLPLASYVYVVAWLSGFVTVSTKLALYVYVHVLVSGSFAVRTSERPGRHRLNICGRRWTFRVKEEE